MRFLFDQSADFRLIPSLIALNHDVRAISREYPAGFPDDEVLALASGDQRILITADRDFGERMFHNRERPILVILTGLPGTGKSAVANHAASVLVCPVFCKDQLEATLWRSGIDQKAKSGYAAYELLTTLAEEQLRRSQSAVLDSVATYARIRDGWRRLASDYGAGLRVVECLCSDAGIHRARLEQRQRGINGWPEVTWEEVEQIRARYEPWESERLTLDAVDPLDVNLARLDAYLLND